jgi:deoxyribonuclease IV
MLIGAHVSSSGGVRNSIKNAEMLNIEYLQTFLSAPQSYKITDYSEPAISEFLSLRDNSNVKECYAHAIYLLNFASEVPQNLFLSKKNLSETLNISAKLKFEGVIIHIGSTKNTIEEGIKNVSNNIREVLDSSDPSSTLLLENSAGSGNHIGSNLDHIVEIINQNKGNPRLKVCIDTQHSFAAGYDLRSDPTGFIDLLLQKFGKDILRVVHLNDSKTEFNSKKDRHENIGEGKIGYEALQVFCTDMRLKNIPLIMEVPGFEGKGPDKKNIEIVNSFQ